MKVFITDDALSWGVFTVEACHYPELDYVVYTRDGRGSLEYSFEEGKNWHRTEESARNRVELLGLLEIDRLQKEIDRLRNMQFKVTDDARLRIFRVAKKEVKK
jgi:hypothetical protein